MIGVATLVGIRRQVHDASAATTVGAPHKGSLLMRDAQAVHRADDPRANGRQRQNPERLLYQNSHFLNVKQRQRAHERHRNGEPATGIPDRDRQRQVPQTQHPGG